MAVNWKYKSVIRDIMFLVYFMTVELMKGTGVVNGQMKLANCCFIAVDAADGQTVTAKGGFHDTNL